MTTHTPGPWRRSNDARRVYSGHAFHIADTFGPDQTANARLIAAAPDLLAALRAVRAYHSGGKMYLVDAIDAAIAKAEGTA